MRFGIVGVGGIAKSSHIPSLVKLNQEIVAFCDIDVERAKRALIRDDIPIYTDYKEMIAQEKLDCVAICTPNHLHHEIAIYALEKGLHVICEKPDSISSANALKMKEAQEKANKVLMVVRNNRFLDSTKYLKNLIASGQVGDIYAGRCGWIRRRGIPGKGGWFTTAAESGGGPLIDLGVHMIDLAIYLMGNPKAVSVVGSVYEKFANNQASSDSEHAKFGTTKTDGIFDVEDLAMGFIKFDNGACLQIEFSWASNIEKEENFVELRATKAGFSWSDKSLKIFTEVHKTLTDINPIIKDERNGHLNNYRHFINVIEEKEAPIFTIDQGINVVKIIEGLYLSAKLNKEIIL